MVGKCGIIKELLELLTAVANLVTALLIMRNSRKD
jgi:hypothetical protein